VSLNISLSHSRSFEMTPLSTACISPYYYSIVARYVSRLSRTVSEIGVTFKSELEVVRSRSLVGFLVAFDSNCGRIFSRCDTIHERDRRTPSQPPAQRHRPRLCIALASRGNNRISLVIGRRAIFLTAAAEKCNDQRRTPPSNSRPQTCR